MIKGRHLIQVNAPILILTSLKELYMIIDKFGPPEWRGVDLDCDVYFRLNKSEADTISNSATQAAIGAVLTAAHPVFGPPAAALLLNYLAVIAANKGPNGCSVKMTIRAGGGIVMQMKEFIAEPI